MRTSPNNQNNASTCYDWPCTAPQALLGTVLQSVGYIYRVAATVSSAMRQHGMGDGLYLYCTRQEWLLLAVVLELFSRRIVGRHTSCMADESLVLTACAQALRSRCPPKGLVNHSGQGSVYKAARYGQLLDQHGMAPNLSQRGNFDLADPAAPDTKV